MKRLFSFILALALLLSLSVTAFASATGSITITNATEGQTYYLYKVFDASYATDSLGNPLREDGKLVVSYSIKPGDKFYEKMFGSDKFVDPDLGDASTYFDYNPISHKVEQKSGISNANLFKYLGLVADMLEKDKEITATGKTVKFENLEPGYYLINRGVATAVTVNTNAPHVTVVDKNQKPNVDSSFNKLVWDEDTGTWVENSSANVGDTIKWKIPFKATNYDGEYLVEYYSIRDRKSSSLWVEFNSVKVYVDGVALTGKGYYWCAGDHSVLGANQWGPLANPTVWTDVPGEAAWFLIHYGFDDFEVVIPWMDDFTFEGVTSQVKGYKLTFDYSTDDGNGKLSEPLYNTKFTHDVEVCYDAAVGPAAADAAAQNAAELDWKTINDTSGPEDPEVTTIKTYKLGVTKVANDGTSTTPATRLGGAVFELYRSYDPSTKVYADPVYVIPTDEDGVYILDDVNTVASGEKRPTARKVYAGYWEGYIKDDPQPEAPAGATDDVKKEMNRRNDVETEPNGQLVVMGLEAGTYYLKESQAPSGYNQLTDPVVITVGTGETATYESGHAVYSKIVVNNRGMELPSTGGEGTMMMITIGTMMAIAFAVLLITQKKMSIYQD